MAAKKPTTAVYPAPATPRARQKKYIEPPVAPPEPRGVITTTTTVVTKTVKPNK